MSLIPFAPFDFWVSPLWPRKSSGLSDGELLAPQKTKLVYVGEKK